MGTTFGNFWDRITASRAGDDLSGQTMTTMPHSLPATNPEIIDIHLVSIQAQGHNPGVALFVQRGNASLNTVGFRVSSTASCPVMLYEVNCATLWSKIR